MINARIKFTYDDYVHLPEGERYEVIEGDLMMVPSPEFQHQKSCADLFVALNFFVKANDLGIVLFAPVDVLLSKENVVQPDILFISKERMGIITKKNIQGGPDLVIEISSPGTKDRDRTVKKQLYAKYGVREYWFVDLDAFTIEVMILGEGGFQTLAVYPKGAILKSGIFPNLALETETVY